MLRSLLAAAVLIAALTACQPNSSFPMPAVEPCAPGIGICPYTHAPRTPAHPDRR